MMNKATRCLLFLVVATSLLLFTFAPRYALLDEKTHHLHARAGIMEPTITSTSTASTALTATSSTAAAPSATSTSTAATTTSAATSPSSSQATTPTSTTAASTTPTATSTSASQTPTAPPTSAAKTTVASTDAQGATFYTTIYSPSGTTSASSTPTAPPSSGSSGLGTGSIVGLSVAGGVAAIGIISFFIWKFTRKRFTDYDDNEAIKWPELNTHGQDSHPLPTNSTGRSGFGAESDVSLTRAPSLTQGYAQSANTSTPDLGYNTASDPYAVPPLPHLNPSQPYRDEPAFGSNAYYDPYRGPIPNAFHDGASDTGHGAEAIPMTQMSRTRSPGPGMAFDMAGRASPALSGGRHPQATLGYGMDGAAGRASPAPQGAYGYGPR